MHYFYYCIEPDSKNANRQNERVRELKAITNRYGLSVHEESVGNAITLQVETPDDEKAVLFKLSAESALYDGRI